MNTVEKRRQARRNKFFAMFDRKVAEGRLSDVIQSSLGYALTYYHTIDGNMYKEWMNEKQTKKEFHIHNNDERRIWVRLLEGKSEDKVEPLNLMFDEWRVQWSDEEVHLEWYVWVQPVFHHHHGIQPHVDTCWVTQDTQSHRWSIGTPSYHSQGSHQKLA